MKYYRCPWCGRSGMPKYLHFFRFIPRLNLLQHYNWEKCKICGKHSTYSIDKKRDDLFTIGYLLLIALVGTLITDIICNKITYRFFVLLTLILSGIVFSVVVQYKYSLLKRAEYFSDIIATPLIVTLDTPLNLNIETIFSVRLKSIVPSAVVAKSTSAVKTDLVEEYKKDGAPVYVEKNSNGNYRIGLLNPEFYNLDVFEIGTEFDLLGVEGGVISTGRIESVSTEIPKE